MKPEPLHEKLLVDTLRKWHSSRFEDLEIKGLKFARCLKSSARFGVVEAGTPTNHVGRVIVDGVLQQGKNYELQVRPAVNRILQQDQADTISGFISLLESRSLIDIINFKTENTKNNLLNVARFFQRKGVNTLTELFRWLEPEKNRDSFLTKNSGLKGLVFIVSDKSADYFRELVGHWDAVAVDRGIRRILAETIELPRSNTKKWPYKENVPLFNWRPLNWVVHREI